MVLMAVKPPHYLSLGAAVLARRLLAVLLMVVELIKEKMCYRYLCADFLTFEFPHLIM